MAGALGVVLVRERRAEQRHHAVAGVLVHGALEAMHAVGEEGEEAIHHRVPFLGVHLLGECHRALHVGEEDGDRLALADQRRATGQDAFGEMARRIRARRRGRRRLAAEPPAALIAELCGGTVVVAAGGAAHGGWVAQKAEP
jgi:hypothetical protein